MSGISNLEVLQIFQSISVSDHEHKINTDYRKAFEEKENIAEFVKFKAEN